MSQQRRRKGICHDLTNKLHRNLGQARQILAHAKTMDADMLKSVLKNNLALGPVQKVLLPNPFPTSLAASSATENPLPYTDSIRSECIIAAYSIGLVAAPICDFLHLRHQYESNLLLGDFAKCHDTLGDVEKRFGFSLWLIEARITLAHVTGGNSGLHKQAAELSSPDWHNTLLGFLIKFHIYRTRLVLKPSEYQAVIQFMLDPRDSGADGHSGINDYLKARILPYSDAEVIDRHLAIMLYIDQGHSAIDRYFGLLKALKFLLVSSKTASRNLVGETINMLPPELRRNSWLRNVPILTSVNAPLPLGDKSREFRECYSQYLVGDLQKCLTRTEAALTKYPGSFEFCELHVKTLIKLDTQENPYLHPQGRQAQILRWLFEFYSRGKEAAMASTLIAAVVQQHPDTQLSSRIGLFLAELGLSCDSVPILSILESADPELDLPRFLTLRSHSAEVAVKQKDVANAVANLPLARTGLIDSEGKYSAGVQGAAITATKALDAYLSGDYLGSANIWRETLEDLYADKIDRFEAIRGRLRALVMAGERALVVQEIVDAYIVDEQSLGGLVLMPLGDFARSPDRAKDDLNFPIALYVAARAGDADIDPYRVHAALDDLLEANGVERPSQLRHTYHTYPPEKLNLLLEKVCVLEVLEFSCAYQSTLDLEGERLDILRWLSESAPEKKSQFQEELREILRAQSIRSTIQHVHQSKIYVNTDFFRTTWAQSVGEPFERIKGGCQLESAIPGQDKIAKRLSFNVFHNVFLTVLLKDYIFNNEYGLDSYLSTRIRHGTLVGQLRSEFEKHGLVTRQAAGGGYHENSRWLENLRYCGFDDEYVEKASETFAQFSETIYVIIDEVRSQWIQIRETSSDVGMFDFTFTESELVEIYTEVVTAESIDVFIERLLAQCWNRTCRDLAHIRFRLRGELQAKLLGALDTLERDLVATPRQRAQAFDLVSAITSCRTGIQVQVATVADWFTSNARGDILSFDLDLLVDACVTFISKIMPESYRKVEKDVPSILLRGEFIDHFFSVFSILIENVFKHSRGMCSFSLTVEEVGGEISIVVKNQIPEGAKDALQVETASLNQMFFPHDDDSIRQEGGSGYIKLHKLVRGDLGRGERYQIVTSVEEEMFVVKIQMSSEGLLHANSDR